MDQIILPAFFDAHTHLRQGAMLRAVAPWTARCCDTCLVMPNTTPPIVTANNVRDYAGEVRAALGDNCLPLMAAKLLMSTTPNDVTQVARENVVAYKLYPASVTTNSDDGIPADVLCSPDDYPDFLRTLQAVSSRGMVLCLHAEMPGEFVMDREVKFLPFVSWLVGRFPNLRVVVEHVTSARMVEAVQGYGNNVAATITAHHLMMTLDDVVGDKLDCHNFCKPVAKYPEDRIALRKAAIADTSGKFFLGSDSAPHTRHSKEHCGCAGCFTAPVLPELLAWVFDGLHARSRLGDFVSNYGRKFYRLRNAYKTVTLVRKPHFVPEEVDAGAVPAMEGKLVPFMAGKEIPWSLEKGLTNDVRSDV